MFFVFCIKGSNSNAKSRHSRGYHPQLVAAYHQFHRNCISSSRRQDARWRVMRYSPKGADDIRMYISPQASYTFNDIPLLSQWIKKSSFRRTRIFWLGNRDSNPNKQSQSLSCYRYTIPQCGRADIIIATFSHFVKGVLKFFEKSFAGKNEGILPRSLRT